MILHTRKGDFASLQHIRAAYLTSDDGAEYWLSSSPWDRGNDWDPSKLHISELGACPRAIIYRLSGSAEKPRSASSAANRTIMFHQGYTLHYLTYSAMNWAGILIAHEKEVEGLEEPWTGRCDALFTTDYERRDDLWLLDIKTVLPAALKYSYDMPKEKDCLQVAGYAPHIPGLTGAVVESVDRAGSNEPILSEVDLAKWIPLAEERKRTIEQAVRGGAAPELPGVYTGHYEGSAKKVLTGISFGPDWRCGYCPWHLTVKERRVNPNSGREREWGWTHKDSTCKPYNLPSLEVAKVEGGRLVRVKSGHEEGVERFFARARKHYAVENDESE